jgi:hypothetical protein
MRLQFGIGAIERDDSSRRPRRLEGPRRFAVTAVRADIRLVQHVLVEVLFLVEEILVVGAAPFGLARPQLGALARAHAPARLPERRFVGRAQLLEPFGVILGVCRLQLPRIRRAHRGLAVGRRDAKHLPEPCASHR